MASILTSSIVGKSPFYVEIDWLSKLIRYFNPNEDVTLMIDTSQLAGLVMELISILCQGTIAGLIVLVATNWLQRKKEKDLTCKNALLVWLELHEHLAIIQDILAHQTFPQTVTPISFSTPTWQNSQLQLTALPIDDLKFIGAYYQSLPAVSHLINTLVKNLMLPRSPLYFRLELCA